MERSECRPVEYVARPHAIAPECDEPGVLQDLQMLGDRGLRERQATADIAAAATAALGERADDREPNRMSKSLQPLGGIFVLLQRSSLSTLCSRTLQPIVYRRLPMD